MNIERVKAALREMLLRIGAFFTTLRDKLSENLGHASAGNLSTIADSAIVLGDQQLHELELLGESLHIDKERVLEGEISIRKEVITETQVIRVPVTREELVIERKNANGSSRIDVLRGQ